MKIALVTSVGEKCGIAAYTRGLIDGLEMVPGVEVQTVPITAGKQPREHYIAQAEAINGADIDCVHIQHEYSFWGSVLPGRWGYWDLRYLIKKPIVITAHTTYKLEELLHMRQERQPLRWLAKRVLLANRSYRQGLEIAPFVTCFTIVHTEAIRAELIQRGANARFVKVIPSGIPPALPGDADGFRLKWDLVGRRVVTLFGFIHVNKGYEITLDILPRLPADVVLVIAGGIRTPNIQPYLDALLDRIRKDGLESRVRITGYLNDHEVADAMEASDVVVTPHSEAGNSYSVMLPLAHGRAVLASDADCFLEIESRGHCLETFRRGDEQDYLSRLLALLDDSGRREALGERAVKYAGRFSWQNAAMATIAVYRHAIAAYGAGHHPPQLAAVAPGAEKS